MVKVEIMNKEEFKQLAEEKLVHLANQPFVGSLIYFQQTKEINGNFSIALRDLCDEFHRRESLKNGKELGVSDVARGEHGALHEVGKCNASGQDTAKPSATDVDGALEKIIDGGNRFYCKNKFIDVDGDIVGDCFEQCDKCKSMKPS